jgi:hypothetical protein
MSVVLLASSLAFAQAKPKTLGEELSGPARESFEQAKDLFEAADFGTAHAKYKEAYALSKNPRLLWNLAACSARQKRYAQAITEAERYLADGRAKLTADQIAKAETALTDWRAFVATATLTVTPSGAELRIDDEARGVVNAPVSVYLDVGKHEVHLERAGHEPLTQALVIREVGKASFTFALKPIAAAPARLVVNTDLEGTIELDGKPAGKGLFEGTIAPGAHRLRIAAPGKAPYENTIEVAAGATKQLTISLTAAGGPLAPAASTPVATAPPDEERKGAAWWPWAVGGAVLAAGAGVGAYYLFKPEPTPGAAAYLGTLGSVEVR